MGGLFKPTTKVTYTSAPSSSGSAASSMGTAGVTQATEGQAQEGARIRGARRRGRQLLSDARLNPESGIQTLGSDQGLGG